MDIIFWIEDMIAGEIAEQKQDKFDYHIYWLVADGLNRGWPTSLRVLNYYPCSHYLNRQNDALIEAIFE